MDAMIFAAGLGTRLRPLTDTLPKPLIPVGGVPMLERVARRLIAAGADRLVINTHHLGEQIERFVADRAGFGVDVRISRELGEPLETGGALRFAAPHFRKDAPFLIHNSDVLSDVAIEQVHGAHRQGAVATLAVLEAATERWLAFDDDGLVGYAERGTGREVFVRAPRGTVRRHDFTGIHVASPSLFGHMPDAPAFSLMSLYLKLAAAGARIDRFVCTPCRWIDIGSHEALALAESLVADPEAGEP
jgi:N-acetyl-alpha-D-muramate 1-phosphate uridylyltransferase